VDHSLPNCFYQTSKKSWLITPFSACRLLDPFHRYSRSKSRFVRNLVHCGYLDPVPFKTLSVFLVSCARFNRHLAIRFFFIANHSSYRATEMDGQHSANDSSSSEFCSSSNRAAATAAAAITTTLSAVAEIQTLRTAGRRYHATNIDYYYYIRERYSAIAIPDRPLRR